MSLCFRVDICAHLEWLRFEYSLLVYVAASSASTKRRATRVLTGFSSIIPSCVHAPYNASLASLASIVPCSPSSEADSSSSFLFQGFCLFVGSCLFAPQHHNVLQWREVRL